MIDINSYNQFFSIFGEKKNYLEFELFKGFIYSIAQIFISEPFSKKVKKWIEEGGFSSLKLTNEELKRMHKVALCFIEKNKNKDIQSDLWIEYLNYLIE